MAQSWRFAGLLTLSPAALISCGGSTAEPEQQRTDGGRSGTAGAAAASGAGGSHAADAAGGFGGAGATRGSGGADGGEGRGGTGAAGDSGAADGAVGGSGAGAGGTAPVGICSSDSDCRTALDCCVCTALSSGEEVRGCGDVCALTECDRWGVRFDEARCVAGRCVLDRRCDAACEGVPNCRAGGQPFLDPGGFCGPACLPPTQCSQVSSCSVCEEVGAACVIYMTAGRGSQTYHCVSVPDGCDGSCECMRVCSEETGCSPLSSPKALMCYRDCPAC